MRRAEVQCTLQENKHSQDSWLHFVLDSFYLPPSVFFFLCLSDIYIWHLLERACVPGSPPRPPLHSSLDMESGRKNTRSRENRRGEQVMEERRRIPSFLLSPGGIKPSDAELADRPTPASWSLHTAVRGSIAFFLSAVRLHKRVAQSSGAQLTSVFSFCLGLFFHPPLTFSLPSSSSSFYPC